MQNDSDIIRPETAHAINGCPGRLFALRRPPAPWKPGTFASQKWVSETRPVKGYGTAGRMNVEVRFDDDCKNGRNTFAITATVRTKESDRMRDIAAGGCMHEEIAKVFPELAHLIPWHLCSTDGPMHYVGNTTYLAGNRDCWGKLKGEPRQWETRIRFQGYPFTIKQGARFTAWLQEALAFNAGTPKTNPHRPSFDVVAVEHEKTSGYQFGPKFTFAGYPVNKWHECPFDTQQDAEEFAQAVLTLRAEFVKVPTSWGEGKERELDKARSVAVWPEATDEQLSAPKAELEAALIARLPALLARMRADIEAAGFLWECPAKG